jgi:SAM-dependent methyltransferase
MAAAEQAGDKARAFFEELWKRGDYWELESSPFEAAKYARQLELVSGRRYGTILEVGCGGGVFTRSLAPLARRVVALDVSPAAVTRARSGGTAGGVIDYRVINVMEFNSAADGPFDLIVMSETIYYLGWLYPFFDVAWLAATLFDATSDGGRFLMTNTYGGLSSYLHRPWLIQTYRDLFRNVGYRLDTEESFVAEKGDVRLEAMICLYAKPPGAPPVAV